MKKWLFSNDGKVSEALSFSEAQEYISDHLTDDLYVWHPSFTYWMPLHSIDDFDVNISIPTPPAALPKGLLQEYKNQEEALFKTLSRVDNTLGNTRAVLAEVDEEINAYFKFTEKLNSEVELTLQNVRKQYEALQKNINEFKKEELVF